MAIAEKWYPSDECSKEYKDSELPAIPFLPQKYIFKNGIAVVCRNAKKDDDEEIFAMFTEAAEKGMGYGADEFLSLSTFRVLMLLEHHCVVFEEESTGSLIGSTFVGDSWYVRSKKGRLGESSLVVSREFRGKGLGGEMTNIELGLLKDLGYRGTVNDSLASNHRMGTILRKEHGGRMVTIGVIPNGTFTAQGIGWEDQLLYWNDFDVTKVRNFMELARESLGRQKTFTQQPSKL